MEEWKEIKGWNGKYEVSNLGNIRSLYTYKYSRTLNDSIRVNRVHNLILGLDTKGYSIVKLCMKEDGIQIQKTQKVHRLVAQAFILNPENKPEVNHIDGCKTNNKITNLEWVTSAENTRHAIRIGLAKSCIYAKGEKNFNAKQVIQYDKNGNFIKIFGSIVDAANEIGLKNTSNIILCCKGKRKSAGGFSWKYVEGQSTIENA